MLIGQQRVDFYSDNRLQNELRKFSLNRAFYVLLTCNINVVLMFELPIENNKHLNFEQRGQGRGADNFVL